MRKLLVVIAIACLAFAGTAQATTWDLAADFSDTANPNGPWAYGEVIATAGVPSLTVYTNHTGEFDGGDWGPHQPAWYSSGPWYWSMLKSIGGAPSLDCPVGRVGGHAHTGFQWTAPEAMTASLLGGAWKMRNSDAGYITLWIKGVKLIDHLRVKDQSVTCNSTTPYDFATMIADQSGNAAALYNISFAQNDTIYVQVDGNDFTGLDATITTDVVPEPSALCALSAGLFGLLGIIRRRS